MQAVRKWIAKRKPFVYENSRLPVLLSKIAPIQVFAFSFGPWVFCREEMPEDTRRHETIHYHQQLEMLFIFQWLLYGYYWIAGKVTGLTGKDAYYYNPFEREAYENDADPSYIESRPLWAWRKYIT